MPDARSAPDVLHILYGGFGGQFSVVSELSRRLRARGLTSDACLYAPAGEFVANGVASESFDDVHEVVKQSRLDLEGSRRIGRLIRAARPSAVLWHSHYAPLSLAAAAARASGTRAVVMVEHHAAALRTRFDELRSVGALAVADAVVFQSDQERGAYRHRALQRMTGTRGAIIPNGVDLGTFRPSPQSPADGAARSPLLIGMIARMVPGKDFEGLVLAAAALRSRPGTPPFRLLLAGDGPQRAALEALAEAEGMRDVVTFLGQLAGPAVVRYLQELDVLVHATSGESVSMSLLEAYATGLPVVTSNVAGVRNMVRDGVDGILVAPGRPSDLADALQAVLSQPERRRELGSAARTRAVQEFGSDAMGQRYLDLLHSLDPAGPWRRAEPRRDRIGDPQSDVGPL